MYLDFMEYCNSLKFDEDPAYDKWIDLFDKDKDSNIVLKF